MQPVVFLIFGLCLCGFLLFPFSTADRELALHTSHLVLIDPQDMIWCHVHHQVWPKDTQTHPMYFLIWSWCGCPHFAVCRNLFLGLPSCKVRQCLGSRHCPDGHIKVSALSWFLFCIGIIPGRHRRPCKKWWNLSHFPAVLITLVLTSTLVFWIFFCFTHSCLFIFDCSLLWFLLLKWSGL